MSPKKWLWQQSFINRESFLNLVFFNQLSTAIHSSPLSSLISHKSILFQLALHWLCMFLWFLVQHQDSEVLGKNRWARLLWFVKE